MSWDRHYLLYINETNATIATIADDTALRAVDGNVLEDTNKLQRAIDKVSEWTKRWRIKLNEAKSTIY